MGETGKEGFMKKSVIIMNPESGKAKKLNGYKEFYDILRKGIVPSTCAISPVKYMEYFEPHFAAGNDILYVHFSKAMSGTFNALNLALVELKEKYPERNFYMIDTKAITALSYLIVTEIGKLANQGMTAEELVEWSKTEVDKYAIYYTHI